MVFYRIPLLAFILLFTTVRGQENENYSGKWVKGLEINSSESGWVASYLRPAFCIRNSQHSFINGLGFWRPISLDHIDRHFSYFSSYRYYPNPLQDRFDLFFQLQTGYEINKTINRSFMYPFNGDYYVGSYDKIVNRFGISFSAGFSIRIHNHFYALLNYGLGWNKDFTQSTKIHPQHPFMDQIGFKSKEIYYYGVKGISIGYYFKPLRDYPKRKKKE